MKVKLYESIYSSKFLYEQKKNKLKLINIKILIENLKQFIRNILFIKKNKGVVQIFASSQQKYLLDVIYKKDLLSSDFVKFNVKSLSSNYSTKLTTLEQSLVFSSVNNRYSSQIKNIINKNFLLLTQVNISNLKNLFKTYKINANTLDNEKLFFLIALINKIIKNK